MGQLSILSSPPGSRVCWRLENTFSHPFTRHLVKTIPRCQPCVTMSSNFHLALSKRPFKLELASFEISISFTSLTLSCISPSIFMSW